MNYSAFNTLNVPQNLRVLPRAPCLQMAPSSFFFFLSSQHLFFDLRAARSDPHCITKAAGDAGKAVGRPDGRTDGGPLSCWRGKEGGRLPRRKWPTDFLLLMLAVAVSVLLGSIHLRCLQNVRIFYPSSILFVIHATYQYPCLCTYGAPPSPVTAEVICECFLVFLAMRNE